VVTSSPPTTTEQCLAHYGSRIPQGIGRAARCFHMGSRDRSEYPITLAVCKPSDGQRVSDGSVEFINPIERDGVLARLRMESGGDWEYWAFTEDCVKPAIHRLTDTTSLVVVDGREEYLPTDGFADGDGEGESGFYHRNQESTGGEDDYRGEFGIYGT